MGTSAMFLPALSTTEWSGLALAFLGANALKATAILLAAFAIALLLRQASAAVRHLVWAAALSCLLALPLVSFVLPAWNVNWPARFEMVSSNALATPRVPAAPPATVPAVVGSENGETAATAAVSSGTMASLLVAVWALGFCVVLGRMVIGRKRVAGFMRRATALENSDWSRTSAELSALLEMSQAVTLVRSDRIAIPMTAGFLRPVILLPDEAEHWPAERRWVVLAHELLHVKRADYGLWMLARLACAFYWFHPLAWLAAAELRREAEQACDNGVLCLGAEAPAYAEHLVSLARGWAMARTVEPAAMAMAQPSHLEGRIRALLDPRRNRREASRPSRLLTAAVAVLLLVPLAALRAPAQGSTASLAGTVSDVSSARLPGAQVILQRLEDQSKAVTLTKDDGEFVFASLPAGNYKIEVRKQGFQVGQQDVTLAAGARQTLDLTLDLGRVTEAVEVIGKSTPNKDHARPSGPPRRIRVGGDVQASKLLTSVYPAYPEDAQRDGVEGTVMLEAVILTDGSLGNAKVANTLGEVDPRLIHSALEAVRFWRYQPTLLNGVPVEIITTITITFRLQP